LLRSNDSLLGQKRPAFPKEKKRNIVADERKYETEKRKPLCVRKKKRKGL